MRPLRILLVRLSAIGDCIHALPVLEALKNRWPDCFLGWAIQSGGHSLLEGHPQVDRFHLFPRNKGQKSLRERWRDLRLFRTEIREVGYDWAIDLQGLTKSALVSYLSGAPRRLGFRAPLGKELSRLFYTERFLPAEDRRHVVEKNLALLEPMGIEHSPAHFSFPAWIEQEQTVDRFLREQNLRSGEFVIFNPGTTWETKRWSEVKLGRLAAQWTPHFPVVATWGDPEEKAQAERLVQAAGDGAILAPSTTLAELGVLIRHARLFVGHDTGPMHLAAALGTPTLAIFGATDPERNGPFGSGHRFVVREMDCQPCWSAQCARGDRACLEDLEVSEVLNQAKPFLVEES